jgi:hypothetical protein
VEERMERDREWERGTTEKKKNLTNLVSSHEGEEIVYLLHGNVLLHERAVIIQQMRGGLLSKQIEANLALHKGKLLSNKLQRRKG